MISLGDLLAKFEKPRKNGERWMVKCPAHADGSPSLQVSEGEQGILLKCFGGCPTEAVVGALGLKLEDLFYESKNGNGHAAPPRPKQSTPSVFGRKSASAPAPPVQQKLVKAYDYFDERMRLVYQACRLEPGRDGRSKEFRQRRPNPKYDAAKPEDRKLNPRWLYNMDGVTRVLYRLPQVAAAKEVWILEGEKDAENVRQLLGVETTTNVGGAKKWLDAYTEALEGKDVVLCGDTDQAGKEHMEQVFESLAGRVGSVRTVDLPEKYKDATEFIEGHGEAAKQALTDLYAKSPVFHRGVNVPVYTMAEIEESFAEEVRLMDTDSFDLGTWLPSLGRLDPLIAGDLVLLMADTGVGKTSLAQNLVMRCLPRPTVFFEIELTREKMFRRFLAIKTGKTKKEILEMYRAGRRYGGDELRRDFHNLFICPESEVTVERIDKIVEQSALKLGCPPKVVVIDYAQLVGSMGKTRYERASHVAEALKVIAKKRRVVMVVLSQVGRPDKSDKEKVRGVGLHDAKDSGSLENSSSLAIGAWRDPQDASLLYFRVVKATEGGAGLLVKCNFEVTTGLITERAELPSGETEGT